MYHSNLSHLIFHLYLTFTQSFILSELLIGCGYQLETTNMKFQRQEYSCSSFPLNILVDLELDIGQKIGASVLFQRAYRVRL